MSVIYVVFGQTGEYSDHREWPVRAYVDKRCAEVMVVKCSEYAREIQAKYSSRWDIPKDAHPLDPCFKQDYTGTNYYMFEIELES